MHAQAPVRHEVLFYSEDETLIEGVSDFIARALRSNDAAIVMATESHRQAFIQRLNRQGFDADGAIGRGTYISVDAAELLAKIMVNGMPDGARFFNGLSDLTRLALEATKSVHSRVALFGECVSLLCALGNASAAIRFEKLGNVFVHTYQNVEILCAYPLNPFPGGAWKDTYESICKEHSAIHVE